MDISIFRILFRLPSLNETTAISQHSTVAILINLMQQLFFHFIFYVCNDRNAIFQT